MEKKAKNKIDKKNFPSSIRIQFLTEVISEIYESYLFKIYIKVYLLNKNLKLKEINEIQIFQQKYSFIIIEANFNENNITEFYICEETKITFDILENNFSQLSINKGNSQMFDKSKMKIIENLEIIGLETEINKLSSMIEYNLLNDNNKASINNKEIMFIRGILIQGPSGTGKTFLVKYLSKRFEKSVSFFEIKIQDLV